MAHTIPKIHILSNNSFRYESHIFGKPPKNIFRVTLFLQIRVGFPVYKYQKFKLDKNWFVDAKCIVFVNIFTILASPDIRQNPSGLLTVIVWALME